MCFLSQTIGCIIVYQYELEMQNTATENHVKFFPSAVLHPSSTIGLHNGVKKISLGNGEVLHKSELLKTNEIF